MSKGTKVRHIRVEDPLWTAARMRATRDKTTVAEVVRKALVDYTASPADDDGHVYSYDLLSPYPTDGGA